MEVEVYRGSLRVIPFAGARVCCPVRRVNAIVQATDYAGERIIWLRGEKVLLDADLAKLYGVTTARLNEQVKRNAGRFPSDFAFRVTNN